MNESDITIRKTRLSDLYEIYETVVETSLHNDKELFHDWAISRVCSGQGYTCLIDNKVIACAGIHFLARHPYNTAEVWGLFSSEVYKHKKTFYRVIRDHLHLLVGEYEIVYLYADSRIGFEESQRLLEHLGFERMDVTRNNHFRYRFTNYKLKDTLEKG